MTESASMSDHLDPKQIEQISDLLAGGRKIEAIKLYREATGKGLREAKDFIEKLVPRLKEQDPEKFENVSSGFGCASVVIFSIIGTLGTTVIWLLQVVV